MKLRVSPVHTVLSGSLIFRGFSFDLLLTIRIVKEGLEYHILEVELLRMEISTYHIKELTGTVFHHPIDSTRSRTHNFFNNNPIFHLLHYFPLS